MSKSQFAAAFPTHPVQDQFGSIMIQFGLNKAELITAIIAAQLAPNEKLLPETIAEYSYSIALSIIEHCEDELKKEMATGNNIIDAPGR